MQNLMVLEFWGCDHEVYGLKCLGHRSIQTLYMGSFLNSGPFRVLYKGAVLYGGPTKGP